LLNTVKLGVDEVHKSLLRFTIAISSLILTMGTVEAQQQPSAQMLKAKEFFETAGIPGDK